MAVNPPVPPSVAYCQQQQPPGCLFPNRHPDLSGSMTDADYGNLIVMGKVTEAGLLAMLGNDHSRLVRVKREAVLMRQQQQRRVSYEGRGKRGWEGETFPTGMELQGGGKRRCSME